MLHRRVGAQARYRIESFRAGSQSSGSGQGGAGPGVPAALAEAPRAASGQGGREVTGALIGSSTSDQSGDLAFGAPGLHSASAGGDQERLVALGIGAAALLLALGGAQWERRRGEAVL